MLPGLRKFAELYEAFSIILKPGKTAYQTSMQAYSIFSVSGRMIRIGAFVFPDRITETFDLTVIRISAGFYIINIRKTGLVTRCAQSGFVELRIIVRCISGCKAIRPCNAGEACCAGNNNAIRAAAAMDDQKIAVRILTTNDADVGIIGIEHQIARLRVAP